MLRSENSISINSTMEEKAVLVNCSVNELHHMQSNMPNSNPNPNGVNTDGNITNLATTSKQEKVADIQDVTTSSSDEKMKEAPQSPTCEKNKYDKRVAFRSNHSSRSNFGKRGKAGYEIVLSQIPKHADLKIVKGAIRARIGKFKCVRCEMYRHGMCKIWVRKPDTRDKILNNAIYIFGVQIKAGLEAETGEPVPEDAEAEQLADVYLSNIPASCTVKKLMGMVKQIVGDFVACNRVVIEKGTSKITFKYSKHQRTLLKNGFGGELSNVVIQSTPSSPKAGDPVKKNSFAGTSMVRTDEVPDKRVIDSMSCSDTSNSAGGSWHQQLSNMSISNDSDSGMSTWSEMVTAASNMRKPDAVNAQNVSSLATAQYEAAAEMLYAQQQQRRNNNTRRRRGSRNGGKNGNIGRGSSLSANYLMLENEKLRMEIELMRMQNQYSHSTEESYGMRGYNGYEPTSLKNAYAEADPRLSVDVDRHLDDFCALPEFHGSVRQSDTPWMMHKYRGGSW